MEDKNEEAVLERLLNAIGTKKYSVLAEVLGVKPQSVSDAKAKKKVPVTWAVTVAAKYGVTLDWLLFGIKPIKRSQMHSSCESAHSSSGQAALESKIAELEKENRLLKEANESHRDALWACKIAIQALQGNAKEKKNADVTRYAPNVRSPCRNSDEPQ